MEKQTKRLDYLQPRLKAMEIKARQVLCDSRTGGIKTMGIDEEESI